MGVSPLLIRNKKIRFKNDKGFSFKSFLFFGEGGGWGVLPFKCARVRPKQTVTITDDFTSISASLIYCITCIYLVTSLTEKALILQREI